MDKQEFFIESYVHIRNAGVFSEGKCIVENKEGLDPLAWCRFLYQRLDINYPKFHKMDILSKTTIIAGEVLLRNQSFADTTIPLVFANRGGSIASDENHAASLFLDADAMASPAVFVYTLPNIALGELSIKHRLQSPNVFFIFDRFEDKETLEFLVKFQEELAIENPSQRLAGGWLEANSSELDVFFYCIGPSGLKTFSESDLLTLYKEHS